MRQIFTSPDIAKLGPVAFLKTVVSHVWPFVAVSFLFALLVLLVPRTLGNGADAWLTALRPVNAMVRELALSALLLLAGVTLMLRRVPPGKPVLLFTAALSQAFVTFFLYLVALFVGLLVAWPLFAIFNAPMDTRAALLGPLFGLASAVLVYASFILIHRLGAGTWPGGAGEMSVFHKLDGWLRLNRLPDMAVRGIGLALVVLFFVLFWTGLLL